MSANLNFNKMKIISFAILFLMTVNLFGQINELEGKVPGKKIEKYTMEDTIPKVIYLEKNRLSEGVKFYLNGKLITGETLTTINPKYVEEITVEKEKDSAIYVTLTKEYQHQFISLSNLKIKYLDTLSGQNLFFIDDRTIYEKYSSYLVDEKNIMSIEVKQINNPEEGIKINLIGLYSRTEENLKKANRVILRGEKFK